MFHDATEFSVLIGGSAGGGKTKSLQELSGERTRIMNQIKAAKQYATSTAQNIAGFASLSNITSALPAGGAITGGALLAGLQQDLAKIRKFNDAIQRLIKLGLNKNILQQIIAAGPDQGLRLAEALLSGPASDINKINQTERQILKVSNSLGREAANAMYDTGKYAGKGFLSGLEHQQKAIEKLMERIAEGMIRTLRKKLGISSPSMVAHWHGLMFAQGLANGIDQGSHLVDEATGRLAGRMQFRPGGGGGGGRGGDLNVHIDVHVPGGFVGSNQELTVALAKAVQPALLQLQKRNPVNQQSPRHAV